MRAWPLHLGAVVAGFALVVGCSPAVGPTSPPTTTVPSTPSVTASPAPPGPTVSPGEFGDVAIVRRVIDGDTVELDDGRKVRARGVDSPETRKPGTPVQCYGVRATEFAKQTLLDRTGVVVASPRPDKYGRTLAWIGLPDGRDYSMLAVEGGYARVYQAATTDELRAAEATAKANRVGLWGQCSVELG